MPNVDSDADADLNASLDQRVVAEGGLVATGRIVKTTAGALTLEGRTLDLSDTVSNDAGSLTLRAEQPLDLQVDLSAARVSDDAEDQAEISVESKGDLTVGDVTLSADSIALRAGDGVTGTAVVRVGAGPRFEGTTAGTSPPRQEPLRGRLPGRGLHPRLRHRQRHARSDGG